MTLPPHPLTSNLHPLTSGQLHPLTSTNRRIPVKNPVTTGIRNAPDSLAESGRKTEVSGCRNRRLVVPSPLTSRLVGAVALIARIITDYRILSVSGNPATFTTHRIATPTNLAGVAA